MNNEELEEEIILEPDPARIMEGLRDTGYEFNTAMADIIDNSIAADATTIKVKVDLRPDHSIVVYVADNGIGMNLDGLKNAMTYGSKERIDPSSLGKFGLGLKTASTAFCRSLSVLSKDKTSEYNKVRWDLDEICKINKWKLLQPEILEDEIELLEEVTNGESGTLVIWEKVDRLMKDYVQDNARNRAFERLVTSLKHHLAKTYQRFLDKELLPKNQELINLYLNDERIEPWDPFCRKEKNSEMVLERDITVNLDDGKQTSFHVAAWVLPRKEDFSSTEAYDEARVSNDNLGFYVYRENRLVYDGGWLGMYAKEPHYSYLRVDFSFDHTLDDAFHLDIKKSQIQLNNALFDYLKYEFLKSPRRAAEESYRKGQNKNIQEMAVDAHDASNNSITEKAPSLSNSKIDIVDASKGEVNISNSQGTFAGVIKIEMPSKDGQYSVVPVNDLESGILWEPRLVDGNLAVAINQSHPYYTKVYAPNLDKSTLIIGMDSLLWALVEAEMSIYNDNTKEQYVDMRVEVSRNLRKLVADLPDPKTEMDSTSEIDE